MSAAEFVMWMRRNAMSPLDETRADYHAAMVCAFIANFAGKQRSGPPAVPTDFMPFKERAPVEEVDPVKFFKAL